MAQTLNVDPALQRSLDDMLNAYNDSDPRYFDFLDGDVTVYITDSAEPFQGRDAYRAHFEPILTGHRQQATVLRSDTYTLGDRVMTVGTVQIERDDVTARVRQAAVWVATNQGWKIRHLQAAQLS